MSTEPSAVDGSAPAFAYLFWVSGARRGQHAPLHVAGTTIGRGGDSEIVIDDPSVSDEHARLRKEDGEWFVYDLASDSGTTVAGSTVFRQALVDGDCVGFGDTNVVFRILRTEN